MSSSLYSQNRLVQRMAELRAKSERGIAPYVTGGDGGLETTLAVLRALDESGATCVELGVPFSDPVADGPVLQAAADRSLAGGCTFEGVLDVVRQLRAGGSELPIAIFCYANSLVRRGWQSALQQIAHAGADAVLVPDLPVEEGQPLSAAAAACNVCPIFFVSPSTSKERIARAAEASRGFLYAIGRFGVTGGCTELSPELGEFLSTVVELTDMPLAVGFGLRNAEQIRTVQSHADLAIVGSWLVDQLHQAFSAAKASGSDPVQAAADAARRAMAELSGKVPT